MKPAMPEMSAFARSFCTGRLYRVFARRVLTSWGLQGVGLAGHALEIGSGSGAMAAQILASFPELRLTATDYDPDMVAVAQRALAPFGERAQVLRADASHLPFDEGRFDAVLSFAMLHHVGDWKQALAEAVRVLRPGGRLIGYDLLHLLPFRPSHGGDAHSQTIRPGQLEAALAQLPVSDVQTRRAMVGLVIRFLATRGPRDQ
jgi:SAM-dependent methyltransferase